MLPVRPKLLCELRRGSSHSNDRGHFARSQEMGRSGSGGRRASTPSKHDIACSTCHLERRKYEPAQSACDTCHGGDKTIEGVTASFAPRLEELTSMETVADDYPAAYTNFTMLSNDKSDGVHNPAYAKAMLNAINSALGEAPGAVTPAELPSTGGEIAGVLSFAATGGGLMLTLLGACMALIGRRRR